MDYFRVANWDNLQHYKDRNPPWIKLHNSLLDDYDFSCLPDASKAHLIAIMMLASRTENKLPDNPEWLKSKIGATSKVNILPLIDSGFLEYLESNQPLNNVEQDASNPLAKGLQPARPEKRQRREEREQRTMFGVFWNAYPKKVGKPKALEAWLKIETGLYQQIIDHVATRAEHDEQWEREDGQFIPYPATFLNQERWEDEWEGQESVKPVSETVAKIRAQRAAENG
jgi:hypothetical protein|tara:strand:+ start:152 stop:832 length:681 start_codon:yes stop_codon:yes gene_type:complete